MLTKIALSVALALTASAAIAAPKHAVRHQPTVQVPAKAYMSLGAAPRANTVVQPSNHKIQDIGFKENL